jgi:NAD(P)-dependent dehydrogenase (short-subunit alcohol dehydrogenase family)
MSANAFSLKGQTALITGGGTGLGLGIAGAFVTSGVRVVITGRRESVLREAVNTLGPTATYRVHDGDDIEKAGRFVDSVSSQVGPITILVNNAGNHLKKPFLETSESEVAGLFHTHLLGAYALSRAVAASMIEKRHGVLLFIASMASMMGIPNIVAYTVAKSAYVGLVRSLTSELSSYGVRVNAIAPGWIETPMLQQALDDDPQRRRRILERTPMARFGSTKDIGLAAVFLSSPAAAFITGAILPVDGGASIGF